jgi:EAL domain-containing protein (putative c-di-GMP-specific phosphodiesterase class I)
LLAVHPEVNPHCLELEILETSALSDIDQVLDTMNACHELEVRFALDDFGTGYSSLTYLRRLPAYLIKIDQSFVRNMLEDPDDLAIVEGVVGLAKAFQREVIAEGVETIAHGVALRQLGCELAQGYGIARPMPADDIPEWVSSWEANDSKQLRSLIEAKTT